MITRHAELVVYQRAFAAAMRLFEVSKAFPREEAYSLTDQMRRASRSVCSNLAEAWRKRRYSQHFKSKLSDSEAEAAETQVWIHFAVTCRYLDRNVGAELYREYDEIIRLLVAMIRNASRWTLPIDKG